MAINWYVLQGNDVGKMNSAYMNGNTIPELGNANQSSRGNVLTPQSYQQPPRPDVNSLYTKYIDQFSEVNPETANMLRTSYNDYGNFTESAGNINNLYNNMYSQTDPYYQNFARINQGLDNDIVGKLGNQLQQAYSQYGPQGDQTRRIEDYYAGMANNIAAQNAANIGSISAQAAASGANTGAQRQAVSQAQLNANTEYSKLKQSEIQNYDSVYQNLNQYIDNFVKTYANSKDKYVRDTYNQLLQYKSGLEQARANSLVSLEGSRLQDILQKEAEGRARRGTPTPTWPTALGTDASGRTIYQNADGSLMYGAVTPDPQAPWVVPTNNIPQVWTPIATNNNGTKQYILPDGTIYSM